MHLEGPGSTVQGNFFLNIILHNSIYPYPAGGMITSEASCFENLFFLVSVPEDPMVAEMARFDLPEDEDQLELNMPWLKVVSKLSNSFNFHCTHQNFCHPNCYRRQMRATKRIMEATRHVSYSCNFSLPLGYEIGHLDYFPKGIVFMI